MPVVIKDAQNDSDSTTISVYVRATSDRKFDIPLKSMQDEGLFGFPQRDAKVLCDNKNLKLSVACSDTKLLLQALLWKDNEDSLITGGSGGLIGDRSTVSLDLDADFQPSKDLDREYHLNPWSRLRGMYHTIILDRNSSTVLLSNSQGSGCIRYVHTDKAQTVRVDTYAIPLKELSVTRQSTISLRFHANSEAPSLSVSSTEGIPHVLKLGQLDSNGETTAVPDGRRDTADTLRPQTLPDFHRHSEYESSNLNNWKASSWRGNFQACSLTSSVRHSGGQSVQLTSDRGADDFMLQMPVVVIPGAKYRLSGWIRTENVIVDPSESRRIGACLAVDGRDEASESVVGTSDWRFISWDFDAGSATLLWIGCRLGHRFSTCTGTAWFDDLQLEQLETPSTISNP